MLYFNGNLVATLLRFIRVHAGGGWLRDAVATKLALAWSPQQVAGWLHQAYPDDPAMHVSHETIYLSLFIQSRGVLKKALQAQLRQRHTYRRPRTAAPKSGGYIVGAVSIRERPATAADRAVPGHWEGDLLVGARNSYIATLVERRSRYGCLVRLTGKETQSARTGAPPPLAMDCGDSTDRSPSGCETAAHRPGHRGRNPCSTALSAPSAWARDRDAARGVSDDARACGVAGRRVDTACARASC